MVSMRSKTSVPDEEIFEIQLKHLDHDFLTGHNEDLYIMHTYKIDVSEFYKTLKVALEPDNKVTGKFRYGPGIILIMQSYN